MIFGFPGRPNKIWIITTIAIVKEILSGKLRLYRSISTKSISQKLQTCLVGKLVRMRYILPSVVIGLL
jgi:hypothetical protein